MTLIRYIIATVLFCILSYSSVMAQELTLLQLGYSYDFSNPDYISRENISNLEMAPISFFNSALDQPIRGRPEAKLAATVLAVVVDHGILITGHEYGHLSAFSRLGYDDFRYGDSPSEIDNKTSPLSIFREAMSWSDFSVNAGESASADIYRRFGASEDYYEFAAAMEGGGLNQNQATLIRYRDRLFDNRFMLLDSVPYGGLALSTFFYSGGGDIRDYVEALDQNGIHTSEFTIKLISLSRLFSGSAFVAGPSYIYN